MNKLVLFLVSSLLSVSTTWAALDEASLLDGMSSRIERASAHGDEAALSVELAKCEALLGEKPQQASALYYKGWILLGRASRLNPEKDKAKAKTLFEAAEAALTASLEARKDGETLSLHASTLERSISVRGGLSAMKLGPKASREHDEAVALAPTSPRVALLNGISLLNRPGFVGGSVEKALAEFKRAAALFEQENGDAQAATQWAPRWGKAEIWAWIGQAEEKLGHKAEARAAYEKGLSIDPEYGWIKHVLLPRVSQ